MTHAATLRSSKVKVKVKTNLGANIHELTAELLVAIVEQLVLVGERNDRALKFCFLSGYRTGKENSHDTRYVREDIRYIEWYVTIQVLIRPRPDRSITQ